MTGRFAIAAFLSGGSLMIFVLPDDSFFCIVFQDECTLVHAFILEFLSVAGLSLLSTFLKTYFIWQDQCTTG